MNEGWCCMVGAVWWVCCVASPMGTVRPLNGGRMGPFM